MTKPLSGLKILDFTYLLPGPYGTMILADMGADIIKVENSENPDIVRLLPPHIEGVGAAYAHVNRGKKSLALNLKKPAAREIIYRLVREYDIVIEQFRPGTMSRMGIGYEDLRAINPSIIYCAVTGYGQTGAYADRAGHDINYMALSGLASFSGSKEGGPGHLGFPVADIAGGSKNLAIGVLAACIGRERTGMGDYIDIAMTDAVFAMSFFAAAGYLAGGSEPARGDLLSGGALYDYYRTADGGYLSVGPIEQKFFASFCEGIGCPEIAATGIMNWNNKERVAKIIAEKPLDHWREVFSRRDACVEPVLSLGEALDSPPLAERKMVVETVLSGGTTVKQPGNPIKFASGHYVSHNAGAHLGHHNREILLSAGYSEEDIRALQRSGVISGDPPGGPL